MLEVRSEGKRWIASKNGVEVRFDLASPTSLDRAASELDVLRGDLRDAVAVLKVPALAASFVVTARAKAKGPTFEFTGVMPLQALDAAIAAQHTGRFLRWAGVDELVAIDLDVKQNPYHDQEAQRLVRATGADRGWVTDGGGLRLVFQEHERLTALERSLVGLLLGELQTGRFEQLEILHNTRKPPGRVFRSSLAPEVLVARARGRGDGSAVDPVAIEAWCAEHDVTIGEQRYEHELCPIDPKPVSGDDPVRVLADGVYCHRCAGVMGNGWRSWATLVEFDEEPHDPPLIEAAREWVHFEHQRHILGDLWGKIPRRTKGRDCLAAAWRGLLIAAHPHEFYDPEREKTALKRLAAALNPANSVARAVGNLWVTSDGLEPLNLDRGALQKLPWTRGDAMRAARAQNAVSLAGFTLIMPTSLALRPGAAPAGVVLVQRPRPRELPPVIVPREADLMSWEEAFAVLAEDYPGIDSTYLKAMLTACVCDEAGRGPSGLVAVGPTGSAKTTTVNVGAMLLCTVFGRVPRVTDEEDFKRQVGQSLVAGRRPLLFNEVAEPLKSARSGGGGRGAVARLLDLHDPHVFRPLHREATSVPFRAPLVLTAIHVPFAFDSPEAGRRFRVVRLTRKVPRDWRSGPPISEWRDLPKGALEEQGIVPKEEWVRARTADSLVTHAIQFAAERDYSWTRVADDLGLPCANEVDPERTQARQRVLRAFYAYCRDPEARVMSEWARAPSEAGWIDLARCELLKSLMPSSDSPWFPLTQDLQAQDWASVLGFDKPAIQFEATKISEANWVGRFSEVGNLRGRGLRNEHLPNAPIGD